MEYSEAESVMKAAEEEGLSDGAPNKRVSLVSVERDPDPIAEDQEPERHYEVRVQVPNGPTEAQQDQIDAISDAHDGVQVSVEGQHDQSRVRFY